MWVRAVAVALVVGCVSGAAMAAGYTEVWNPPEASKPLKRRQGDVKVRTGAGSKHVAGMQHKPSKVASSAVHGDRAATHPHAVNVSAKPAVSHPHAPGASAARSAGPANANSNPAMASSGSLPPIIH